MIDTALADLADDVRTAARRRASRALSSLKWRWPPKPMSTSDVLIRFFSGLLLVISVGSWIAGRFPG